MKTVMGIFGIIALVIGLAVLVGVPTFFLSLELADAYPVPSHHHHLLAGDWT